MGTEYPIGYTPGMDIGAMIEQARREAGLTQSELAERSGTSQATISAYESGHKDPSSATLVRLLAATGHRLDLTAGAVVRSPGKKELDRRGRILEQVIELAEALPVRHAKQLAYPPLRSLIAARRAAPSAGA